ncbi:unnamed protein product [Bursaphelenchus xylophilus]|uniref:Ribonucleoside-diphosphate reductase n=1 Tax=Bursaphelenchus xylophilus TaxID=6326 RepID=A0A1I7RXW7_BURXY|nr:unnamed protein product [Bursaphelenchus xylophilus]CAG9125215.1 unnamed protein product [Bursaphelenchus xylophilus]
MEEATPSKKARLDKMNTVITKRDGRKENFDAKKLEKSLERLTDGLDLRFVNPEKIAECIAHSIPEQMNTTDLANHVANTISSLCIEHSDHNLLAGRVAAASMHKTTHEKFSDVVEILYNAKHPVTGKDRPLIAEDVYKVVQEHKERLDSAIVHHRDFNYAYFGFRTLVDSGYLLQLDGKTIERPQHMIMRVALGIHKDDVDAALETYDYMSKGLFTHATPTLFNAGTPHPQMSSCFLVSIPEDSMEAIFATLHKCANIIKYSGGIGVNIHGIRAKNSLIAGANGYSKGILPMLKLFNGTASFANVGGKRPSSIAIYLEPWHPDVFDFVQLKVNTGEESMRIRDLFYALWVPDLFMKRVKEDKMWSLMCPLDCPGLDEVYGKEFEKLYTSYEDQNRYRRQVKARDLWRAITNAQSESGVPYLVYKDACNEKSNQKNLGTIKSSNLCTEIIEYSNKDEIAVCNLASLALPKFVSGNGYDFEGLKEAAKVVTKNLNKIIDGNFYPVPDAKRSNLRHRPIGLGVQGLADVFQLLRHPFTSEEARRLNVQIFETIYYGAVEASTELAVVHGPYETYNENGGCPAAQGQLSYDLWNATPTDLWDWNELKKKVAQRGLRNSLFVAPMPTASTAQILGNNESFEPFTSNCYTRRVTKGDFQVVNPHLCKHLCELGLWTHETRTHLAATGSLRNADVPEELKELYKTVWEIKQTALVEMAAQRAPFIDQSQSLNLYVESPNYPKLTTLHFKSWELGLKTGMYYLRSKPSVDPVKFTLDRTVLRAVKDNKTSGEKKNTLVGNKDGRIQVDPQINDENEPCLSCQ